MFTILGIRSQIFSPFSRLRPYHRENHQVVLKLRLHVHLRGSTFISYMLWYLPLSLPMWCCNGFSMELSNFEGERKGRRPTQVLMSRIVACFLQGNVRMVVVIFLEKIIVFSKSWVWIFKNAGFSKQETQTSRLDSRVLKFEFGRVSSRDFRGWSRDFQFYFERFCNFPFSAFPVLFPALEWTKMEAACRAGHLQVPIPIGAGVLD